MNKLTEFLDRNDACREGLERLAATGATTPEEAWARADASDLIWAVTRPGVMSKMQRRKFLSEAVLAPIEHLLTDERSKNILRKLRANECVTQEDNRAASRAAYSAASWEVWEALWSAAYAAKAEDAEDDASADAAWASAMSASAADAYAVYASAREAKARWIRENFALSDLNIN